jgi:hypothetical protein
MKVRSLTSAICAVHIHFAHIELRLHMLQAPICRHHMRQRTQRRHIVERELLARQLLGGGLHADHRHMKDPDHIGAERIHKIGHAVVEAIDHRGDGNDGGHADHDAEHRQARAQLVGAQRVERHLDEFAGLTLGHCSSQFSVVSCLLSVTSFQM